jgi:hypothetical protein
VFDALPSAASLVKANAPPVTTMLPTKLFAVPPVALLSNSIVPVPDLVHSALPLAPAVPVTWPLRIKLGRTFEVMAPLLVTLNVVKAWLRVVVPLNATP